MHTPKWKVVFMWLWLWSDSNQLCIPGHTQEMCLNFLSLPVHSTLFQQKVFDQVTECKIRKESFGQTLFLLLAHRYRT